MPFSIVSSKPWSRPTVSTSAATATPAVLRPASSGRSLDDARDGAQSARRAPACAVRGRVSPTACTLWPRTSKPTATLPTLAGANAIASSLVMRASLRSAGRHVTASPRGRRTRAADRRTRRRRDGRAGARALHDERIAVVAAGHEADDVVGEVDVGERMRAIELDEADRRALRGGVERRRRSAARGRARARPRAARSIARVELRQAAPGTRRRSSAIERLPAPGLRARRPSARAAGPSRARG